MRGKLLSAQPSFALSQRRHDPQIDGALTIGERRDLVHTIDRAAAGSHPLAHLLSAYALHEVGIDLCASHSIFARRVRASAVPARWVVEDFITNCSNTRPAAVPSDRVPIRKERCHDPD